METDFGNKTKMCDELKNTVHKTKTEMSNSFVISAMWDHVVESVPISEGMADRSFIHNQKR